MKINPLYQEGQSQSYPLMSGWPYATSAMPNPWLGQAGPPTVMPRLDVLETESSFVYLFEMAGADKSQLNVEVSMSELSVSAPVTVPATCSTAVYHYQERLKGNYARILAPPPNVNTGELSANYENGILEIVFPKIEKQTKQGF